jgi:hypothetical protein
MNDSNKNPEEPQMENRPFESAENIPNKQIVVGNANYHRETLVPKDDAPYYLSGDFSTDEQRATAFFSETRENVKPLELPSSSSTTEQVRLNRIANRIATYHDTILSMHQEILDPKPKRTYVVSTHVSTPATGEGVVNKKTYVYLIESESGKTKIGISINPRSRKNSLATPERLSLEFVLPLPNRMDALMTEDNLHMMFRKHQKRNEWFSITAKEIVETSGLPFVAFKGLLP